MSRREELEKVIPPESLDLVDEVLDEVVFLENKLAELRELPFIQVNPKNPMQQRNTPAAKMYKELLQQYINCIKMIEYVIYKDKKLDEGEKEDSPLRKWVREYANKRENNMDTR